MALAIPRQDEPVNLDHYIVDPALRALVCRHIGARSCPSCVGREALLDIAVRHRLVTADDASRTPRTARRVRTPASGPLVLGKRQRADRATKIQRRKVTKMLTVKCALRGRVRCGADPAIAIRVVRQLQMRVEAYSKRVVNASLAFSGIVKGLFRREPEEDTMEVDDEDLAWMAQVPVPAEFFTQTFFRQLMLGTEGATQPSEVVVQYHQAHPQLLLPGHRHLGDRNIYSAAATQYLTNLKNALREEVDGRIKVACRRLGLPPGEACVARYRINGWTLTPRLGCCLPQPEAADSAVSMHRRVLGLEGRDKLDDRWLEDDANLPGLLRYNAFLNKVYQAADAKLFNVVPICKVRAHYIRVDTSVLFGVLRDAGVISKQVASATFDTLRDVFWNDTFDFRKIKPGGFEFGGSISTDGVSLCSTFEKAVAVEVSSTAPATTSVSRGGRGGRASSEYDPSPDAIVVGNDPGRVNIYYMAGIHEGQTKVVKLTRKQYYTESGCITARRNSERWSRGIKDQLVALSDASTKGISCTAHEWHLSQFEIHKQALWDEYLKPRWARQRLSLYGGKKRVFANFFNRLARQFAGGRLVVAYGNARFPSGAAGEQSVPTTRAYKECASRVETYWTDEFRTSKVHCVDDSVLELVATMSRRRVALRGLLFNPSLHKFVSRDLNAALNIRRILLGPRPDILCRQGVFQRLEQEIVIRIRCR